MKKYHNVTLFYEKLLHMVNNFVIIINTLNKIKYIYLYITIYIKLIIININII